MDGNYLASHRFLQAVKSRRGVLAKAVKSRDALSPYTRGQKTAPFRLIFFMRF